MPSSAWGQAAQGVAHPVPFLGFAKAAFGRRLAKRQKSYEKARMKAAVHGAERDVEAFEQNAPIQQAQLAQSLASRGLGTSSIQEQDTANLLKTQARQRASVNENLDLARKGYSLWGKQAKHAKRMGPLDLLEGLFMKAQQAASVMAGGGAGAAGAMGA